MSDAKDLAEMGAGGRAALDAWLAMKMERDALATENDKLRFALAIRCRHGLKLTQPCKSCAESTEDGCERIIYLDPDGVHLKSKELLCSSKQRRVEPTAGTPPDA
jgi:hypothetical protein